jgi:hypothetical protein
LEGPEQEEAEVSYETSAKRPSGRLIVLVAAIVGAAFAVSAASASAAVTVTSYKITSDLPAFPTTPSDGPSSLQAGGHPDAGSYSTYGYTPAPNASEDVKTSLTNFAPGLLGNAEAVPKCPETALQAGGSACPAGSQIGTSRLDVQSAGASSPIAGFPGTLYNAELLGNEPGRLAAVTVVAGSTIVSSIPFYITPRGATDYGLTGILDGISRLDVTPFGNLQTQGLSFLINGATNNYVRNPTSCQAATATGQAVGYDDPTTAESPAYTFTTTGCETEAFGPSVSVQVGDAGTTAFNGFPPLTVKITQPDGQADIRNTKVTLPIELNTNNPAYKLCTNAQADADACPANSKFGNVTAKSPFLGSSLSGPVYLLQQTSSSLPGLLLDLNGRVHVKIKTSTVLIGGKQIQSIATDTPQLPISELTVALNGGRNTGVFLNRSDLCFKSGSTSEFKTVTSDVAMTGWSGKSTTQKVTAQVNGCGPGVSDKLTGATGSRPALTVTATKHPNAANMKELTVELGSNLRLVKSKLGKGASATASAALGATSFKFVNSHTLKLTGLPAAGAGKVTLKLRKGAIRLSKKTRKVLRRGRSRRFKVRVKVTPVTGQATSTRSSFKVKGKKKH